MKRFDRVVQILDQAVAGATFIGPHGAFWRGKTLAQFVALKVLGRTLIVPGTPEQSALIQALEGAAPFGANLPSPPPGAIFRRMPAGDRPPVPSEGIAFIRQWIADGCPDEDIEDGSPPAVTAEQQNAFWREFDDWAMFAATAEVQNAEGAVMSDAFPAYQAYARDAAQVGAWIAAVQSTPIRAAIELLSARQLDTVKKHYGDPIGVPGLLDGFELFGRGTLPPDALRPQHPQHQMDGPQMWFIWGSFVDACLRLPVSVDQWQSVGRAVLLGLLNDGVFRERFVVTGFTKDQAGQVAIRKLVVNLSGDDLLSEFRKRFNESQMFA